MIKNICEIGKGSMIHTYLYSKTIREFKFTEEDYGCKLPNIRKKLRITIYWSPDSFNNSWYINNFKPIFKLIDTKENYYFIDLDQFLGILVEGESSLLFEIVNSTSLRKSSLDFLWANKGSFINKKLVDQYIEFIYRDTLKDTKTQSPIFERYISFLLLFKLISKSSKYDFDLSIGDILIPTTEMNISQASKLVANNKLGKEILILHKILEDKKKDILDKVNSIEIPSSLLDLYLTDINEEDEKRSTLQTLENSMRGLKAEVNSNYLVDSINTLDPNLDLHHLKFKRENIL